MKKGLIIGLVLILSLAVMLPVLAEEQTTEQPLAELQKLQQEYVEQLFQLRLEFISKRAELGYLTQEQADLLKSRLVERKGAILEYIAANPEGLRPDTGFRQGAGFGPGPGRGYYGNCGFGPYNGRGGRGPGRGMMSPGYPPYQSQ
ncbi:MAG: DUF2680 domain-containing protein [Halanaerobium sp.]|nr:DUF2680 domain-containing protein [Halanaerobium sp.]